MGLWDAFERVTVGRVIEELNNYFVVEADHSLIVHKVGGFKVVETHFLNPLKQLLFLLFEKLINWHVMRVWVVLP